MTQPSVLVVDDAPEVGKMASVLCERAGWRVGVREDLASGWETIQSSPPDVALVDVNLRGDSGLDLIRRARATPALEGVTLLVFCHSGLSADMAAGLREGADGVFAKDLLSRPDAWRERLAEVLARRRGRSFAVAIHCHSSVDPVPADSEVLSTLQQAVRLPVVRALGTEVLGVLAGRAIPPDSPAWFDAERGTLDFAPLAELSPIALASFAAGLVDQLASVVGVRAARPFRDAICQCVLGVSELLDGSVPAPTGSR